MSVYNSSFSRGLALYISLHASLTLFFTLLSRSSAVARRARLLAALTVSACTSVFLGPYIFDPLITPTAALLSAVILSMVVPCCAVATLYPPSPHLSLSVTRLFLALVAPAAPAPPRKRQVVTGPFARARLLFRSCALLALCASLYSPMAHSISQGQSVLTSALILLFFFLIVNGLLSLLAFAANGAPPFHSPFAACSQAQFWAGRWNATISYILRIGVYDPLVDAGLSRCTAQAAAFVISAVGHEVMVWYGAGSVGGRMFCFFIAAAAGVLFEQRVLIPMTGKNRLVVRAFAWFYLLTAFHFLFAPPLLRLIAGTETPIILYVAAEMHWLRARALESLRTTVGL